jgi:uncharacterized protein
MILIRLLMLLLVAWIGWRIYRVLTRRALDDPPAPPVQDMVQCAHCSVHLPRTEAVGENGEWFCCEAHRVEHTAGR